MHFLILAQPALRSNPVASRSDAIGFSIRQNRRGSSTALIDHMQVKVVGEQTSVLRQVRLTPEPQQI
jgi:hypothetical protein